MFITDIKNIWIFRDMIFELTHRELRGKYKGSVLGFLWTYINPLMQILVYAFVFSQIFRSGIEKFHLYLIVSMFPFNFFTGGVLQGLGSVRYQGDLVKKVYFPRQILPIVSLTVNFVNLLISFGIIYSILLISGWGINLRIQLWLIPVLLTEYVFALGLAFLLAAVEVYFRDIEHIVSVLMMVWMYVTPMFYSIEIIPEKFLKFFYCNPMLYIISMFQQILYYKVAPDLRYMGRAVCFAIAFLIVGSIVFKVLEKRFAEEL
ncbi:polysaccharide ABC transporter permease protein [Butyrivibrio proteoclasticus B316]|uniref:Transport permease protein n=1 Tax=Butyrivibrio proteoclasticus (strain ATCC 51982 / DSM 14932 / B316) TaxID=515622 RepID=E0RW38_BUTPB|nr:ABC transporter permease [Butyrivibrio proteoclasticus]ADL32904.1 polysaccharide ABC transporter permease protein [Butyrivibrio proteoclasticus B316]